ncbi:MAG: hypothetical protein GQ527_07900, partial [Bacteroidales bacterium]|nr:hypothetical protein [Bacteroidales bacterium]
MKKFTIIIFSILIYQLSFSQENYLEGHFINNEGDSISGLIDYRNWGINPVFFKFKTSPNEKAKKYTVSEILQFTVADEVYIKAIVDMETSARETHLLNYKPKLKLVRDTVFLQTIIKGEKSLYYHKDKYGFESFYIDQNLKPHLLIYKRYLKVVDKKDVIAENNKYIGQLTVYLGGCSDITSKIASTKYNIYSLKRLFENYYKDCLKTTISFQKETEKDLLEWGVLMGVSQTSIAFSGNAHNHLIGVDFPSSTNFTAGVFLEAVFRRN